MKLIFHDRTASTPEPGAATLVIERKGNFYFSAGAVKRLALEAGSLVLPAQDTDTNNWYMLTKTGAAEFWSKIKPFALRRVGGKNGSRLVFSSTTRARAFYEAHQLPESVNAVHLRIGLEPIEQDFVGLLYPLLAADKPAPAVEAVDVSTVEVTVNSQPLGGLEQCVQSAEPIITPVAAPATSAPSEWHTADLALLRRLYPTTTARDIAVQLGRSEGSVKQKVYSMGLEKAEKPLATKVKAMPATAPKTAKKPANHLPESESINPGLETKLLKLVEKLGSMKLFKMDAHEAGQALRLLTDNVDKLEWVPGAERLRERLAGCFSLPMKMEGSAARA